MVGIILTVTLAAGLGGLSNPSPPAPAAAEAGVTCDQTAPLCDMSATDGLADLAAIVIGIVESAGAGSTGAAAAPDQPRYATPAMIDCRVPVVAPLLQALVGECDGTTRDTSYRASRDPESERSSGSLHPARRERTRASALAACAGIPSEGGDASGGVSPSQPAALFALPDLPPGSASRFLADAAQLPLSRQLRPLERPPRA